MLRGYDESVDKCSSCVAKCAVVLSTSDSVFLVVPPYKHAIFSILQKHMSRLLASSFMFCCNKHINFV